MSTDLSKYCNTRSSSCPEEKHSSFSSYNCGTDIYPSGNPTDTTISLASIKCHHTTWQVHIYQHFHVVWYMQAFEHYTSLLHDKPTLYSIVPPLYAKHTHTRYLLHRTYPHYPLHRTPLHFLLHRTHPHSHTTGFIAQYNGQIQVPSLRGSN